MNPRVLPLALFLATFIAGCQSALPDPWRFDPSPKTRATAAKLQRQLAHGTSTVKLVTAIDYLREQTGAPFSVNWRALAEAGVESDTPVMLEIEPLTAEAALTYFLERGSASFDVVDGVVVIDHKDNLARIVETRVYDVHDLLPRIQHRPSEFDSTAAYESNSSQPLEPAKELAQLVARSLQAITKTGLISVPSKAATAS
jgi:hypothetical protein